MYKEAKKTRASRRASSDGRRKTSAPSRRRGRAERRRSQIAASPPYLDVACELIERPDGTHRVLLHFQDWANGGSFYAHDDLDTRDLALDVVASAIRMLGLRRLPGQDRWKNRSSPGLQRAMWRVEGRLRRARSAGWAGAQYSMGTWEVLPVKIFRREADGGPASHASLSGLERAARSIEDAPDWMTAGVDVNPRHYQTSSPSSPSTPPRRRGPA